MNAEIVCLSAYDVAYEATLAAIEAMMRGAAEPFRLGRLKAAPRNFPVHRPLSLQIETATAAGPRGPLQIFSSVKLFAIGAMSVKVRVPVVCERLMDLVAFRDALFKEGAPLEQRVLAIAQQVFQNVKPQLDTPVAELPPAEVYTVFCLDTPPGGDAAADRAAPMDTWLSQHEREVAALLVGEPDPARLSAQEVQETTKYRYSYYQSDLAVIDWDAALLVDTREDTHDTLYAIEMANLQLAELRVYDQALDRVLDKAYDDVEVVARPHAFVARQRVLSDLREIKMDLTKVADELSNTSKFFGEWHLARIYMGCAARFHLAEWDQIVDQKLRALDGLYTMLQQDSTNRMMLILETAVVGLFVLDLIIIVWLGIR